MSRTPPTILIAGFQHETNTFAPSKAAYENFERGEGFPSMSRGSDVLALRDVNIPAGGFIRAAEAAGYALSPVIWAGASPSAHVTRDAFERIAGEIVEAARTQRFDAVYLDLHGAMVAEHVDDGEGELLARVREVVGPSVPIVASLDLHANVTERMLRSANALVAYRTYPHVDMAETGARAADLLARLISGEGLHRASRRLPFLIPINGMCTLLEPSRGMYQRVGEADGREWRTPPLWGIGLTRAVGGQAFFLHDGRARSLTEAILWHGGEAERSKTAFTKLSKDDRDALIKFLSSL